MLLPVLVIAFRIIALRMHYKVIPKTPTGRIGGVFVYGYIGFEVVVLIIIVLLVPK